MVRVKNRYITFKILYPSDTLADTGTEATLNLKLEMHRATPTPVTMKYLASLFKQHIQENFGDYGLGIAGTSLSVRYFSNRTSTGIVKVSREDLQMVCFAIMCINKISNLNVLFQIERVSGTIRKAQDFLIEQNKDLIDEIEAITP